VRSCQVIMAYIDGLHMCTMDILTIEVKCELNKSLKLFSVWMQIEIHLRENGIPSNRVSRHGESVNK
jgi:hypothetical protein